MESSLAEQRAPLILQPSVKWQKLLINGLIEHDSFPNAQQVSVSKGEDKEFWGNKVPGLERNTSSQP